MKKLIRSVALCVRLVLSLTAVAIGLVALAIFFIARTIGRSE